jgi:hypothetical protein
VFKLLGYSLGELVFASEWKRAAIVRAFVSNENSDQASGDCSKESISHFASRKIIGLKSRQSVRRYYDAWELTGLPDPEPGKMVELPSLEIEFPSVKAVEPPKDEELPAPEPQDKPDAGPISAGTFPSWTRSPRVRQLPSGVGH